MDDANMKFQIANPYPGQISDEQWMQWVLSNTNTPEQQFRFPRGIQHIGKQAEFGPSPMPKVDLSPMAKMPQIDPAAMAPQGGNPMRPGAVPQIGPPMGMIPTQGQMANVGGQPMQPAPINSGGGGGLLSALSGGQGGQSNLPKSLGLLAFGANMMNNTNPRNHLLPYGFGEKLGDSLGAGMGTYVNLNKVMNPARPTGFDLVEVKEGPNIVTYKKHKNGRMERVSESPRSMGKDGDKAFTLGAGQKRFGPDGKLIAEVVGEKKPGKRETIKAADGYNYYVDTAERVLPKVKKGQKPEKDESFKNEKDLRKEHQALSKDFRTVRDAFGRIQASAEDPSAAGDLALIFNYMKVLDPGSTVREGEFATAQNSAGVADQVRSMYNRVISGIRLAPEQRKDFVGRAGKLYSKQQEFNDSLNKKYVGLAESYGLDPSRIVMNFGDGVTVDQEPPSGGLTTEEQAELQQLRARFRK